MRGEEERGMGGEGGEAWLLFFFFFFKQKTAYEIGTGDWSSDVCSSDLSLDWSSRRSVSCHSLSAQTSDRLELQHHVINTSPDRKSVV